MVKRKKRQESFKTKSCPQWGNMDFLRYLDFMLKDYGVLRHASNARRDSDQLNHLYDLLVKKLGSRMDNLVLREYMEWWCSIRAPRLTGSGMWLSGMLKSQPISRFSSRFTQEHTEASQPSVSDEDIYNLGGLSMLLTQRGLVLSHRVMESLGKNAKQEIQAVLGKFQKATLLKSMEATIANSPYRGSVIDFVSLSSLYLLKHELSVFVGLDYRKYFN